MSAVNKRNGAQAAAFLAACDTAPPDGLAQAIAPFVADDLRWQGFAPLANTSGSGALSVNVVDFWRRDGGMFTENWVFVDMVHLFGRMGCDLLEHLKEPNRE